MVVTSEALETSEALTLTAHLYTGRLCQAPMLRTDYRGALYRLCTQPCGSVPSWYRAELYFPEWRQMAPFLSTKL